MRSFLSSSLLLSVALLAACTSGDKDGTDTIEDTTESGPGCTDVDGDGYCAETEDCDDSDAAVNPGVSESCDGVDNDCDGEIDEGVTQTYYSDVDGDGFGDDATTTEDCAPSDGWVEVDGDCDDADPYVYPGSEEICDGVDNNCDGTIDEGLDGSTYYADSDGDTYGNPDESLEACEQPPGYVDNALDCDDTNEMEPVHVDNEAGTSTGTGSATNPVDTVQAGIDMANVCVFVWPGTGTYNEDITFGGKNISVIGVEGSDETTIEGTGTTSVVTFANGETADAVLTGFTITGGIGTVEVSTDTEGGDDSYTPTITTTTYRYYGGGIYIESASPTLYELVVTGNNLPAYSYSNPAEGEYTYVYSYGGGIFAADATIDPWYVSLLGNYADAGGGLYSNSATTLDGKWFVVSGNSASSGGGATAAGSVTLNNSILADNASDGSGGGAGGAGVDVLGGTLSLNQVTGASNEGIASVYLTSGGSLTLYNSILVDNDAGWVVDGEVGTTIDVSYSDVYNSSGSNYGSVYTDPTGGTNISSDPVFMSWSDDGDYTDDSFYLDATSPAAATGDGGTDMGAYGGADGGW